MSGREREMATGRNKEGQRGREIGRGGEKGAGGGGGGGGRRRERDRKGAIQVVSSIVLLIF